mgnify:CR=1 FL=1
MRKWLNEIREEKGLSTYAVAKLAGISQSYYASIETGARGKPLSVTIAKKIAQALGFEWTRFYEDDQKDTA